MDRVLVLMATYNGDKYLAEQLDSIFSQKGVQVSVLVRDDGSSDRTLEILKQYEERGDLRWYQDRHLNVQKGYYELMKEASSTDARYFAFSDQDDIWDEDKLSIAVSKLKGGPEEKPILYYCGQRLVDENLEFIEEHKMKSGRTDHARFILNDAAGCTEVFNRKLLETVVSYEPEYMLMHDTWVLKVCLAVGGSIIVDSDCHMSYRQHGANAIGLKRDIISKLKRSLQYINEQKIEPQMRELKKGYGPMLVSDYNEIIEDVLKYKKSIPSRKRLMNRRKFDYADIGIQMTYELKILLNRL